MIVILGGGFGLYGYLPALLNGCGETVLLPQRYRQRLIQRDDIRALQDEVQWADDEQQALDRATAVVISKRPQDQVMWVEQCLQRQDLVDFILEKPLAPTPGKAMALMDTLEHAGKNFRIAYIFRYTGWGQALIHLMKSLSGEQELSIDWHFQAHHYVHDLNNWKRFTSQGGGAMRFYGIHLIALLAELGYSTAIQSSLTGSNADEAQSWHATLSGQGLPKCSLSVQSNSSANRFAVRLLKPGISPLAELKDPFADALPNPNLTNFDSRFSLLTQVCQSLKEDKTRYYPWYRRTLELWAEIERQSVHEVRPNDTTGQPISSL
jgi:predicted dehydrogenase